uniref:acid phosphatase n=1 Tax=Globodera pallida TaxID=36090 RepID=A0A183CMG3_GLOPA
MIFFLNVLLFLIFLSSDKFSIASDELLLVQALWRHGDRSPTGTFRSDPNQEDAWPQGWGQLSPKGMAQHVVLGGKLKARYIDELKFVSERYLNKEIYLRSTDVNRTLTSAISNMIGFYNRGVPGKDYPSESWPHGFTPVAVHTIASYEDHIIPDVPEVPCPRQSTIHEIIMKTPEYRQLMERKKQVFYDLSNFTGQQLDIYNFGRIADTLFIE